MSVLRWDREEARRVGVPAVLSSLDGATAVVLDGVEAADEKWLGWCRRAPCPVLAVVDGGVGPACVDVVLDRRDADQLEHLIGRITARPGASRVLVDVLRVVDGLDVARALVVESLAYSALLAGPEFAAWLARRGEWRSRDERGDPVRLERLDRELRIVLDRPASRNAMSAEMRDGLLEALTVAELDESIEHVVLSGAGPSFSSGGHLGEFGTTPDVVRAHDIRLRRSVGAVLARLAPRTTVVLHGTSAGAGVELAAFAGRVVARPGTELLLPEHDLGLIPGAGGTVSLTRRIGRQATARLVLSGRVIGVDEALALGLVDELAEP